MVYKTLEFALEIETDALSVNEAFDTQMNWFLRNVLKDRLDQKEVSESGNPTHVYDLGYATVIIEDNYDEITVVAKNEKDLDRAKSALEKHLTINYKLM